MFLEVSSIIAVLECPAVMLVLWKNRKFKVDVSFMDAQVKT